MKNTTMDTNKDTNKDRFKDRFKFSFTFTGRRMLNALLLCVLVVLVGLACTATYPVHAKDDDDDDKDYGNLPADIAVTLLPDPNILVMPGQTVRYTIRIKNDGVAPADFIQVTLPYDPAMLSVAEAVFTRETDWVTARKKDRITLMFREVEPDGVVTADVLMQVADTLPQGTVIDMWAKYQWGDGRDGENDKLTNAAPLVVSGTSMSAPWSWMTVQPPAGPPSTTFGFLSDRFLPNEAVVFWLNTVNGPLSIGKQGKVDNNGRIWLDFTAHHLSPGTYQMVAYGKRSELIAVTTFVVEP